MYLIIDTDFGDDIDDAFSLAYLLKRAKNDIHLVLSAFGDTEKRAQSIGDFLHRAGCDEIPVGVGLKTGEQDPAQYLFQPKDVTYPVIEDGLAEAARLIRESDEVVTLVALGPATNLAALIERYPDLKDKVRIVSMFGSVRGGYFGSPDPINEYNVIMDIPAGKTFLSSGWDIALTPLDTCGNLFMNGERYQRMLASNDPITVALCQEFARWMSLGRYNGPKEDAGKSTSCLFDTVAAYMAFDTPLLQFTTVPLTVDDKGYTVEDPAGVPIPCALSWTDADAFIQHLCEVYTA